MIRVFILTVKSNDIKNCENANMFVCLHIYNYIFKIIHFLCTYNLMLFAVYAYIEASNPNCTAVSKTIFFYSFVTICSVINV